MTKLFQSIQEIHIIATGSYVISELPFITLNYTNHPLQINIYGEQL